MGYWGWRPLMIAAFVGVWITGCTLTSEPLPTFAPTPSPTQQVTLTIGRIGPPTPPSPVPTVVTDAAPSSTATAAPTVTPAPTSPPQTYTVEAGDTLLAIALRYGIDLADLRAANAEADLALLQIGQVLIIPAPRPTAQPDAPTPLPSAPPAVAVVISVPDCYETRAGGVICLGRIDNPTDQTAEQVSIDVRLIQPDGGLAAQDAGAIEQMIIPPQGFAPYRAQFDVPWALYEVGGLQPQASIIRADAAADPAARYDEPTLTDLDARIIDGRLVISAAIVNPESTPITSARAVITLLDAAGRVIGYRVVSFAGQVIAPGEAVPLRVEVVAAAPAAIATYHITVEARWV